MTEAVNVEFATTNVTVAASIAFCDKGLVATSFAIVIAAEKVS